LIVVVVDIIEQVEELVGFLKSNRPDVRLDAVKLVLGVTGSDAGVIMLNTCDEEDSLKLLARLLGDQEDIAKVAAQALVNMSTNERAKDALVLKKALWTSLLEVLTQLATLKDAGKVSELVHSCLKLLNNVTTSHVGARRLMEGRLGEDYLGHDVEILLNVFLKRPKDLPEIGMVLTNITQLEEGRDLLLNREKGYFKALVKLININRSSDSYRRSLVETVRNCCFATSMYTYMLSKTQMVGRVLLPLLTNVGVVDPEDVEDLPKIVQSTLEKRKCKEDGEYDIELEKSSEIRRAVVNSFIMLCSVRSAREILREKKVYSVIKEYHHEETNEETSELVFKLVDLLLGDEEDTGPEIREVPEDEECEESSSDDEDDEDDEEEEVTKHDAALPGPQSPHKTQGILYEMD